MRINIGRAAIAGIAGTVVMTAFGLWVAPMMGIPPMNPAEVLAGAMGGLLAVGWIVHFMIGIILAVIYAAVAAHLPGPPTFRGAVYGIAPFLASKLMVMPMMGMPVLGGSVVMAAASLIGHAIYGGVVGAAYGPIPTAAKRDERTEGPSVCHEVRQTL